MRLLKGGLDKNIQDARQQLWKWLTSHKYWVEWLACLSHNTPTDIKKVMRGVLSCPKNFNLWISGELFDLDFYKTDDPREHWIYIESGNIKYLTDEEFERIGRNYLVLCKEELEEQVSYLDETIKYHEDKIKDLQNQRLELENLLSGKDVEK